MAKKSSDAPLSDKPKVVAVSVVAGVIAIVIFLTGFDNLPAFWRWYKGTTSSTKRETVSDVPVERRQSGHSSGEILAAQQAKPAESFLEQSRYWVRVFNCDDGCDALLNEDPSPVARVGFGPDSQYIEITDNLRPGRNVVKFQVRNDYGTITYGLEVKKDGSIVFSDVCGEHHRIGCGENRNYPLGVAHERVFSFSFGQPKR